MYHILSPEELTEFAQDYFANYPLQDNKISRTKLDQINIKGPIYYWHNKFCLLPFSLLQVSDKKQEDKLQLRILSILGKGGFGTVKLAESADGRLFVVKIQTLSKNKNSENIIQNEESLTGQVYKEVRTCKRKNKRYLCSEFLGIPLSQYLSKNKLNLDQKLSLATKLWLEVATLHDKHRLLHKDLKPDNILIYKYPDEKIKVNIIDFGFAANIKTDHYRHMSGTESYLPPGDRLNEVKKLSLFFLDLFASSRICYLPREIACYSFLNTKRSAYGKTVSGVSIFSEYDLSENHKLSVLFTPINEQFQKRLSLQDLDTAVNFAAKLTKIRCGDLPISLDQTLSSIEGIRLINELLDQKIAITTEHLKEMRYSEKKQLSSLCPTVSSAYIKSLQFKHAEQILKATTVIEFSAEKEILRQRMIEDNQSNLQFLHEYPKIARELTDSNFPCLKKLDEEFSKHNAKIDKTVLDLVNRWIKESKSAGLLTNTALFARSNLALNQIYTNVINHFSSILFNFAMEDLPLQKLIKKQYNSIKMIPADENRHTNTEVHKVLFEVLKLLHKHNLPYLNVYIRAAYLLTCLKAQGRHPNNEIETQEIIDLANKMWELKISKEHDNADNFTNKGILTEQMDLTYKLLLNDQKAKDRQKSPLFGNLIASFRGQGKKSFDEKILKIEDCLPANEELTSRTYQTLKELNCVVRSNKQYKFHPAFHSLWFNKTDKVHVVPSNTQAPYVIS